MTNLTFREQQLLKAFRAADERGKYAVEELARHEAEYGCRPVPQPQKDTVVQLEGVRR